MCSTCDEWDILLGTYLPSDYKGQMPLRNRMATTLLYALIPLVVFSATVPRPQTLSMPDPASIIQADFDSTGASLPTFNATSSRTAPTNSSFLYGQPFQYDRPFLDANAAPICKGDRYGYDLNPNSCALALQRISLSQDSITWGQRGQGGFQGKLPYRYMSSQFHFRII